MTYNGNRMREFSSVKDTEDEAQFRIIPLKLNMLYYQKWYDVMKSYSVADHQIGRAADEVFNNDLTLRETLEEDEDRAELIKYKSEMRKFMSTLMKYTTKEVKRAVEENKNYATIWKQYDGKALLDLIGDIISEHCSETDEISRLYNQYNMLRQGERETVAALVTRLIYIADSIIALGGEAGDTTNRERLLNSLRDKTIPQRIRQMDNYNMMTMKEVEQRARRLGGDNWNVSTTNYESDQRKRFKPHEQYRESVKCYECQGNHYRYDCPRVKNSDQSRTGGRIREGVKCHECQGNHYRYDCPKLNQHHNNTSSLKTNEKR